MLFRTDRNNNPTAFTTGIAEEAGLIKGKDYEVGEIFPPPSRLNTAKLLGDPIEITIRVIDKIGFRTSGNYPRWAYIDVHPKLIWDIMSYGQKLQILAYMYKCEGGTEMEHLFTQDISVGVSDAIKLNG
jgi:hypothetical protein